VPRCRSVGIRGRVPPFALGLQRSVASTSRRCALRARLYSASGDFYTPANAFASAVNGSTPCLHLAAEAEEMSAPKDRAGLIDGLCLSFTLFLDTVDARAVAEGAAQVRMSSSALYVTGGGTKAVTKAE